MKPNPPQHPNLPTSLLAAGAVLFLLVGCTIGFRSIQERPDSGATVTGGVWTSMIYAAHTAEGVVLIDLGWDGSGKALKSTLAEVAAEPEDVTSVFLTHSHRDHIAGWPMVRDARFHMAEAEVPYFLGEKSHQGTAPRLASVISPTLPERGELEITPFSRDTALVFGADTLRAFLVPGHTPGSAAYLFRGVVFAGDALSYTRLSGFRPARGMFSEDPDQARISLDSLWLRVEEHDPRYVCTAHAMCTDYDSLMEEWEWADPGVRAERPGSR